MQHNEAFPNLINLLETQTGQGEIKRFIQQYHQTLADKHKLNLGFRKSLHVLAETLGYESWHHLSAELDRSNDQANSDNEGMVVWIASYHDMPVGADTADGVMQDTFRRIDDAYYYIFCYVLDRLVHDGFLDYSNREMLGDEFDPETDREFDDGFADFFETKKELPADLTHAMRRLVGNGLRVIDEPTQRAFFDHWFNQCGNDAFDVLFDTYFTIAKGDQNTAGWYLGKKILE